MRTDYSIKNSISAVISNFLSFLLAFISQAIFIRILGAEYLGLNGLFTNILTMLSIFELGIGNAIVYKLYKPVSEKKAEDIKSLMLFYKKAYRYIAFCIFLFGIMLVPFIKNIVGTVTIDINIYVIYLLFLLSTLTSYFMTYKRNLIIANQKNYIINVIHMLYYIALNSSQLLIIYFTHNYYMYLLIKIICQILENIIINYKANCDYPYLKEKNIKKIDKDVENDIFKRVKALFYHKIGSVIISGTDNIIISSFLGIVQVGLYTNYYYVINACSTLFGQIISASTASVGNLLLNNNSEKNFLVFKKIRFLNFWIASFTGVSIYIIVQPFICLWVGEEYLLSKYVVLVLVINYYQKMMRSCYSTFKDSGGIWIEDKYIPLVESILNIVFSIILVKLLGIVGVFLGTIISGLVLWCYSYPKFVYKKLFNRSYFNYIKETIGYITLFLVILGITSFVAKLIVINNLILQILVYIVLCCLIPNGVLIMIFRNSDNLKYFFKLLLEILDKLKNKRNEDEV